MGKALFCFALAFPDYKHFPAQIQKSIFMLSITLLIFGQLLFPISQIAFWYASTLAMRTKMPEAAVHKNNGFVLFQYDVRFAWQFCCSQRKPKAEPMQEGANPDFRLGVCTAYARHDFAALFLRECISHSSCLFFDSISQINGCNLSHFTLSHHRRK